MPAAYARLLLEVARQQKLPLGSDLRDRLNHDGAEYLSLADYLALFGEFDQHAMNPDWALAYGRQLGVNAHGVLGLLASTAPTVGEGLLAICRYIRIRVTQVIAYAESGAAGLTLEFMYTGDQPLKPWRACEILAGVLQQFFASVTGRSGLALHWRLPYSAAAVPEGYDGKLWGTWSFDSVTLQLVLPREVINMPSLLRDDAVCLSAQRKCGELLQALYADPGVEDVRALLSHAYTQRVREARPATPIPSAAQIAGSLHISTRTLMRRLQAADTTLRTIKDQLAAPLLRDMLRTQHLPISEIGERLGYDDPGNFTRACRRLMGDTPHRLAVQMRRLNP